MTTDIKQWVYRNVQAGQRPETPSVFSEFFAQEKIDRVIELGTYQGAMALWLKDQSTFYNFKFKTYDIKNRLKNIKKEIGTIPFNFRNKDIHAPETVKGISSRISSPGVTLLLVDGGDKNKEFNLYAPALKTGDWIMVHDYAPNKNTWEQLKDKTWLCWESWDSALRLEEHSLEKKYTERFQSVMWGCFQKNNIQ
jgi:cephalosporin hydroxylase